MTGTEKLDELNEACIYGNLEKVKYLVKNNEYDCNDKSYVLKLAALYGNLEVVKYLFKQGANIHAYSDWALRSAISSGYLEVVLYIRKIAGPKWKCHNCIVRATCMELCDDFRK